jgi:hypothetical protein
VNAHSLDDVREDWIRDDAVKHLPGTIKEIVRGFSDVPLIFGIEHEEPRLPVHKIDLDCREKKAYGDVM